MDLAQNQHDHFFKALMERPRAAGALLRERLPPLVAEQIVGDPALVEGEFVDEEMRGSQSDRLYRVALRGGRLAYIYCLVEHKSAPDPRVALQLLRYLARIWERLDRDAGGEGPLAPILPLVVYHGKPEWSTPTRFSSMLAGADELKPYLLDFPFGLLDAGQVEDEALPRARAEGGAHRAEVRPASLGEERRGDRRLGAHLPARGFQGAPGDGDLVYPRSVPTPEEGAVRFGGEADHEPERRIDCFGSCQGVDGRGRCTRPVARASGGARPRARAALRPVA